MRSRNIKPGLFKNELLGQADPILTILFAGLWCLADKAGRLEDRPLRIKAEVFPYRDGLDINRYLTDLERLGFIKRYSNSGFSVIQVVEFERHQHPHNTEKESELPAFSDSCEITVRQPLNNGCTPSDSLIPDSLIPDSPSPQAGKKRRKRAEIIQGFSDDVKRVVNTLAVIWPMAGKDGEKTSPISPQDFCQRVHEILAGGVDADTMIQAGKDYISQPRTKYAAPQYFFGKTGYGGKGEAPYVGFVNFILTKRAQ